MMMLQLMYTALLAEQKDLEWGKSLGWLTEVLSVERKHRSLRN